MTIGRNQFEYLRYLALSGEVKKLHSQMTAIWRNASCIENEDIPLLSAVLLECKYSFPQKADLFYSTFGDRIKKFDVDLDSLRLLEIKTHVIYSYEGYEKLIEWLSVLERKVPEPNDGFVHLIKGQFMLNKCDFIKARDELRVAVRQSLCGVDWYSYEALQAMSTCQAYLGDQKLAFEYAKSAISVAYRIGKMEARQMIETCQMIAIYFGEIEYLLGIWDNIKNGALKTGRFDLASEMSASSAVYLWLLGDEEDASQSLYEAAQYSRRMPRINDEYFAINCLLLARYMDNRPIQKEELNKIINTVKVCGFTNKLLIFFINERLPVLEIEDSRFIDEWARMCEESFAKYDDATNEIIIHLTAIFARFYYNSSKFDRVLSLYRRIIAWENDKNGMSIFMLSRLALIANLIQSNDINKIKEAKRLCKEPLINPKLQPLNRFMYRQLLSECELLTNNKKEAFETAIAALSDWRRIMEGLYNERYKLNWLSRGESCLKSGLSSILEPVEWMQENKRVKIVFDLTEVGKARIITDMMYHRPYLLGSYMNDSPKTIANIFNIGMNDLDWYPLVLLESITKADVINTVVHNDDGSIRSSGSLNVLPFRSVLEIHASPEKRLLVSAVSLTYDSSDIFLKSELMVDIRRIFSKSGEEVNGS